jgi:hypothetical protein
MPMIYGKQIDGHDFLEPISKDDLELIEDLQEKVFDLEKEIFDLKFLKLSECFKFWWRGNLC